MQYRSDAYLDARGQRSKPVGGPWGQNWELYTVTGNCGLEISFLAALRLALAAAFLFVEVLSYWTFQGLLAHAPTLRVIEPFHLVAGAIAGVGAFAPTGISIVMGESLSLALIAANSGLLQLIDQGHWRLHPVVVDLDRYQVLSTF